MGNTQAADRADDADDGPFSTGDKVKVSAKSAQEFERLQNGHGGFNSTMAKLIGMIGVVTRLLGRTYNNDVMVKFPISEHEFRINTAALSKSDSPSFTIGQTVRLIRDAEKVKRLQVGHGNWVDHMALALGDKANVIKNYPDGDIRVKMSDGLMGRLSAEFTLNPLCVTALNEDGADKSSSSSASSDVSPDQLIKLLRRMLQSSGDDDEGAKKKAEPQKMMTENGTLAQLYENKKFLGQGGFGVVFKAEHYLENGANCAIKVVGFDRGELGAVIKEVHNLASLTTHKNIVSYKSCWIEKLSEAKVDGLSDRLTKVRDGRTPELMLCVRLECCEGNLDDYVENRNRRFFREDEYKSGRNLRDGRNFTDRGYTMYKAVFIDILKGLKFLHDQKIIHRDIKPANILYDKNMDFKFTDFGLAKNVDIFSKMSNCGTRCYAAPEQILSKRYDLSADIYPLGLVLFELMFPIRDTKEFMSLFTDLRTDHKLPPGLKKCYPEIEKLILQMLDNEPAKRPSLESLLSEDWRGI